MELIPQHRQDDPNDLFWQLALAVNAAFKGLLGAQGQSGHICATTLHVSKRLELGRGWSDVMAQIIACLPKATLPGDVVVVADKVVAVSLGRVGPRSLLRKIDPKTIPPNLLPNLADEWSRELGFSVGPAHLLLADEYGIDQVSFGTDDHNLRSAELASQILREVNLKVDVVISDTDTGIDVRQPLIGTVTIGATPLGATRGLNLYEAMRCAVAAEFVRGHTREIPLVICQPSERRRERANIGERRNYSGLLNANREDGLAHA